MNEFSIGILLELTLYRFSFQRQLFEDGYWIFSHLFETNGIIEYF